MEGRILLFGRDAPLLHIRSRVLTLAGWAVTSVPNSNAMRPLRAKQNFDIAIMCHTLPVSERSQAIPLIQLFWPGAKLLVLTSVLHSAIGVPANVRVLDGFHPAELVARCQELMDDQTNLS